MMSHSFASYLNEDVIYETYLYQSIYNHLIVVFSSIEHNMRNKDII